MSMTSHITHRAIQTPNTMKKIRLRRTCRRASSRDSLEIADITVPPCSPASAGQWPKGARRRWLGALYAHVREPRQPPGQVPIALPERLHRCRDEDGADDRRVDQQCNGNAEAHLLERDRVTH